MNLERFNPHGSEQKEKEKNPVEASLEFLKEKWEDAKDEFEQVSGLEVVNMGKLKEALAGFVAITAAHGIWEMGSQLRGMESFNIKGHLMMDAFLLSPFIAIAIKDTIEAVKSKEKSVEENLLK